jgi:GNAT superfamily N-acetyltransferase
VKVELLDSTNAHLLAALFEASHVNCYCRYWHFTGTKNEWLDRLAHRPEDNRAEMLSAVAAQDPGARGLVALRDDGAVGWMKLVARRTVPKLRKQSVYAALDLGEEDTTFSIGCILVHPSFRGQGVARALVRAAAEAVRQWGGRAIEAYPRRSADTLYPEEVWMGPERVFADEGFEHVAGSPPYPVLRKTLLP